MIDLTSEQLDGIIKDAVETERERIARIVSGYARTAWGFPRLGDDLANLIAGERS